MTSKITTLLIGMMVAGATACGDSGSGVDHNKALVSLTPSEIDSLCHYITDVEMGPRSVQCGNVMLGIHSFDECVASSTFATTCTATVGEAEACARAIGDDPCSLGGTACQPILPCGGG